MVYVQYGRLRMAADLLHPGDLLFAAPGVDYGGMPLCTLAELNSTVLNSECRIPQRDWCFLGCVATSQPEISRGMLAIHAQQDAQCWRQRIPFLWGSQYQKLHVGYPLLLATVRRRETVGQRETDCWAIVPVPPDTEASLRLDGHDWDIVRRHNIGTVAGGIYRSNSDSAILFSVKGAQARQPSCGNLKRGQIPVVTEDRRFLCYSNEMYRNSLATISVWLE